MLNKGLRDEKKVKIDTMLSNLLSFVFVPKFWNIEDTSLIDNHLTEIQLTTEILINIESNDLIEMLQRLDLDWSQQEQFADFLIALSKQNTCDVREKAILIYEHIQSESKTFSFVIFNKIALAQANFNA